MKRRSLIIGCPGKEANYLEGVAVDIVNYSNYFLSLHGGAWFRNEITIANNPNRNELMTIIDDIKAENNDYTIVTFSGHGWEKGKTGTRLLLRNDEEFLVKELNTGAKRQLRILDSCRTIEREVILEENSIFSKSLAGDSRNYTNQYREKYENLIQRCEKGITILYACSKDETAGENEDGGYFTQAMISIGNSVTSLNNTYFNVETTLKKTKSWIDSLFDDASQNPISNNERRNYHFPWSLKI